MRSPSSAALLFWLVGSTLACGRDGDIGSPSESASVPTIDRDAVPLDDAPVDREPDAPTVDREPTPIVEAPRPAAGAPKHCTVDASRGEPWAALAAVLKRHEVSGDFGCPTDYTLVRSPFPCGFECTKAQRAKSPELFLFSGRDDATGDAIFVELAHRRDLMIEDGGPCRFTAPFRETLVAGADVGLGLWAEQRFSARSMATVRPLSRWLDDHRDATALDLVTFGGTAPQEPAVVDATVRVFHQQLGDAMRLCVNLDGVECWTRRGVARSRMADEDESGVVIELELVTGEHEAWEVRSTKEHYDESWPGTLTDWAPRIADGDASSPWVAEVEPPADVLGLMALAPSLRLVEPGVVTVGRYDDVGCPIQTRERILEWVLTRHDEHWRETPTIDVLQADILDLDGSMGIVDTWRSYDAEGGHYDMLRLLVFARAGAFVGPLPVTFGEETSGFGGEYSWRHGLTKRAPDCIEVGRGRFAGETFGFEEDARPIAGRIRAYFASHHGRWRITERGLVRGCSA